MAYLRSVFPGRFAGGRFARRTRLGPRAPGPSLGRMGIRERARLVARAGCVVPGILADRGARVRARASPGLRRGGSGGRPRAADAGCVRRRAGGAQQLSTPAPCPGRRPPRPPRGGSRLPDARFEICIGRPMHCRRGRRSRDAASQVRGRILLGQVARPRGRGDGGGRTADGRGRSAGRDSPAGWGGAPRCFRRSRSARIGNSSRSSGSRRSRCGRMPRPRSSRPPSMHRARRSAPAGAQLATAVSPDQPRKRPGGGVSWRPIN